MKTKRQIKNRVLHMLLVAGLILTVGLFNKSTFLMTLSGAWAGVVMMIGIGEGV